MHSAYSAAAARIGGRRTLCRLVCRMEPATCIRDVHLCLMIYGSGFRRVR